MGHTASRSMEGRVEANRVIVCGSRRYRDANQVYWTLFELNNEFENIVIVHGSCPRGADTLAHNAAVKLKLTIDPHPAEWNTYGKAAGFIRNQRMADLGAVLCVAFWDGRSSGTKHMMECARRGGIPVRIVK